MVMLSMNTGISITDSEAIDLMTKRILIVEDEADINMLINQHLSNSGFEVESVYDGFQALEAVENGRFDLVVLDIMLPGIDGWEVCELLRRSDATLNVPIVFLSALTGEVERIKGFDLGGDDYLVKPFSPRELVSRIKAVLKRSENGAAGKNLISVGDLNIDVLKHQVFVNGRPIHLTGSEFLLLHLLVSNEGRVFSRQELLDAIGGEEQVLEYGNVDVHVHNIRHKIEKNPKRPKYIQTVWGVGYRFRRS
jgi:two-component system alkaline phosphatase synthesis response regulator PhoP